MAEAQQTGLPVVTVERIVARGGVGGREWVITCPYCHEEHHHSPEPGERSAHCHLGDGYVIECNLQLAIDDPVKLARAARIMRLALARNRITFDDLGDSE